MKFLNMAISTALLSAAAVVTYAAASNPVVQVTSGDIRGRLLPGGGATFKGVPYASPPVGELRWRDPQPVQTWAEIREAGNFGPPCTQRIADWNRQEAQGNQEDCLYLNVWTPEWPAESPKAVMVWLHGGGNWGGAASVDYMDGTSLSRRGVVVVSINYRLGVFGFFAHPGLTAESSHHSSGNYGLLDQLAALQWVRDNIASFGGDPERVTLFGQSAGAIDTAYLAASPLAKGLIHQTIQQSGPPIRPKASLAHAEQQGVKFAASLNAPADAAAAVQFLRSLSGPDLQEAALTKLQDTGGPPNDPLIDGYLMPKDAAFSFREGEELSIPMIVGNNAHEHARGYGREDILRVIDLNFGELAPEAVAYYGLDKSKLGNGDPLYGPAGDQASADTRHRCPAVAESIWRSSNGRPTYQYEFDPPVAGEKLTRHQAEIGFVFGNLLTTGYLGGPYTNADRKISAQIQTYWTNFAKTGNPNLPSLDGLPEWPMFNPTTRPYLRFTQRDGPVVRESLRREICDLYIEALEKTLAAGTAAGRLD
ncbi:MAG: carboxylesterase family protein [Gammaproteobacteria bacterium]|nr:carboxylesterase family protein [Gammaproteobacteria bacterium]MDH3552135.1 carboxylesterase family protein [Gammaproteobacteria bacterium]